MKLTVIIRCFLCSIVIFYVGCSNTSENRRNTSTDDQKLISQSDSIYVTKIIDGDTFVLSNNETVRIVMIDTPEKHEPLYHEAGAHLDSMISHKAVRLIRSGEGHDRYGRVLAEVMLDTINIGCRMLYDGYAVMYPYSNTKHLIDNYLPAQNSAISRDVGLWALPGPVAEEFYISISGSYRFHRPLCGHIKNSDPSRFRRYENREEALKAGLSPCRTCKP